MWLPSVVDGVGIPDSVIAVNEKIGDAPSECADQESGMLARFGSGVQGGVR